MIEAAIGDRSNEAHLSRIHLGQRRSIRDLKQPHETLENFPLYLDQLIDIRLDINQYATEMAVGLATIHWRAQLDGMDMKFVIGGACTTGELPTIVLDWQSKASFIKTSKKTTRGSIHLWMLDFDKASSIDFVKDWKACYKKMVTAVTANDPYFPNPAKTEKEEHTIWNIFEDAYLRAADLAIWGHPMLSKEEQLLSENLPKRFIKAWKKRAQEQLDNEDGGFVIFG